MSDKTQSTISMEERVAFCRTFFKMKQQDMLMHYILSLVDDSQDESKYIDFLYNVENVEQSKATPKVDWYSIIENSVTFTYKGTSYKISETSSCEAGTEDYYVYDRPLILMKKGDVWKDVDESCPQIIQDIKVTVIDAPFNSGYNYY